MSQKENAKLFTNRKHIYKMKYIMLLVYITYANQKIFPFE